jgi:UDP-glucose 4-epimerase
MQDYDFSSYRNKHCLVTGGAGFLGSTLAARLDALGATVTVIDSLIPEYGGNLFNLSGLEHRIRINISDVRDVHSLQYLLRDQHYLFNLAGQTGHLDSMEDPYTDLEINCRAQLAILESCRKVNPGIRVVFASTRQIYGRPVYLPVDENHPLRPVDVNGINKLAGEGYHLLYNHAYGIRATVLRLTNTYGPRMRIRDARQTFLGFWIRHALEKQPIEVWGGDQLRDFNFASDAINALLLSGITPAAEGQIFNLGGNPPMHLRDVAGLIASIVPGTQILFREFPEERKRIDIGDYYGDFTVARNLLGWKPGVPLEEGLARTIAYYRENLTQYV